MAAALMQMPMKSSEGYSEGRRCGPRAERTRDPCDVSAVASPGARTNLCDLDECFPVSFSLGSRQPGANLGRKPARFQQDKSCHEHLTLGSQKHIDKP
jgi:hypothetical protein